MKTIYIIEMNLDVVESKKDNRKMYVEMSKSNIDKYIYYKDFREAFELLILVLERLDENEKIDFIKYYSMNMKELFY